MSGLKEYKRHVLWLDYFNSSISREGGRRIPLDRSVKDPKIDELLEAARLSGYAPEAQVAKHPKRMSSSSGCVSVEKRVGVKKSAVLLQVAKSLSNVRGKRTEQGNSQQGRRPTQHHQEHRS